ncbi:MAG TPA: single-stranded DNA-binding protein [Firmicutes bacterium]|nr:single-stranded DNA-binding protein [Bacillota bacterium]
MTKVFLIGNLTRDPELTETSGGVPVCRFGVAVNRGYGENRATDFYNVTAWRRLGEQVAQYTKKGNKIAVYGDLQIRQYDGNDGVRRTSVDVMAQDVEFLTPKGSSDGGNDFYDAPSGNERSAAPKKKPALEAFDDDGDIPF